MYVFSIIFYSSLWVFHSTLAHEPNHKIWDYILVDVMWKYWDEANRLVKGKKYNLIHIFSYSVHTKPVFWKSKKNIETKVPSLGLVLIWITAYSWFELIIYNWHFDMIDCWDLRFPAWTNIYVFLVEQRSLI